MLASDDDDDDGDAVAAPVAQWNAVYDYNAADQDEVSFAKGDIILDVREASPGWVIGIVQRTGMEGMLPSNYLQAA